MDSTQKATGLAGLTSLMNQQFVDHKLDVKQAEANVLEGDRRSKVNEDNEDSMNEIYKIAKDLDIKIDGMDPETISTESVKRPLVSRLNDLDSSATSSSSKSSSSRSTRRSRRSRDHKSSKPNFSLAVPSRPIVSSSQYQPVSRERKRECERHRDGHDRDRSSYASSPHSPSRSYVNTDKFMHQTTTRREQPKYDFPMKYDRSTVAMTQEQVKKDHISGVLKEIRGETYNTFSTDVERVQDLKAGKLEQIASLKMSLEEEGIDTAAIPTPAISAPIEDVDGVLNLLLRKNNRYRYSSLAEEVISAGAEILESVFDGTRSIPVFNIKPDYTGYSNTVNVKLHRLRFDTSQIVGDIVEKHNVSPFTRIMMELVPGLLLYPKIRQKQKSASTVTNLSSTSSSKSYNHIRDKMSTDPKASEWSDMADI